MSVAAAAISAGAALAGTGAQAASVGKANKRGARVAKEMQQIGNEFSANEAQKYRDWARSQYELEYENESPAAKRRRLEEAGFNPYMAMQGSGAQASGASAPSGSSPTSSIPSTPQQQAAQFNFSGVSDAINSYYQNQKLVTDTEGSALDNKLTQTFGSDAQRAKIANDLGGNFEWLADDYQKMRRDNATKIASLGLDTQFQELQNLRSAEAATNATTALSTLNAEAQSVLNRFLPGQQTADLMIKGQNLLNLAKSGKLTDAQISSELARSIEIQTRTNGMKIDNRVAKETARSLIRALNMQYIYTNESLGLDRMLLRNRNYYQKESEWMNFKDQIRDFGARNSGYSKTLQRVFGPLNSSGAASSLSSLATLFMLKGNKPPKEFIFNLNRDK